MSQENLTNALVAKAPKWQKALGLKPGDSAIQKVTAIDRYFADLWLPPHALPPAQRDERHRSLVEAFHGRSTPYRKGPDFIRGIDYSFGRYHGNPSSIRDNAANILIDGSRGAPLWKMLKSVTLEDSNNHVTVLHVRGDREIDPAWIEEQGLQMASRESLAALGVEYGTVNPFISSHNPIQHIFDSDLIKGPDYPSNDMVVTSSGDQHIYVEFNVKKYLAAIGITSIHGTSEISKQDARSPERIVPRRAIIVIGGDSPDDTFRLGSVISTSITEIFAKKGLVPTDRLKPAMDLELKPELAGSIDTAENRDALRASARQIAEKKAKRYEKARFRPLAVLNSRAMDGCVGDIMRTFKEFEYIGSQEALEPILADVKKRTETESTQWPISPILLGLPSVYEKELSAFSPETLDDPLNAIDVIDNETRVQIRDFVTDVKKGMADSGKFYQVIEKILRRATDGDLSRLAGRNVPIILGASELESFVNKHHKVHGSFAIIKVTDPAMIDDELAKVTDPKKIRLVFIQPGEAIAKMVAQKTLGLKS